jgi:diguanylate cyclase (GGDEF)-like protein
MSPLRALMLGASVATGVAGVGLWAAMRLSQKRLDAEKAALETSTQTLRKRNEQLTSLYNVFSEITETLTMKYVVATTVREALKIMGADMVLLRKLEGEELVVLKAQSANGVEVQNLPPVSIDDDGPTGRVYRKGRSISMQEAAELTMGRRTAPEANSPSVQTGRPPLESGIIAPLIVGARVVGTISCWAVRKNAFTADDERILEMMASSVATAMVAADALTNSERRAHRDPLTDLPNRRQLNQDLDSTLGALNGNKRSAVVAMVDIDHFKRFNDQFGHRVGDITLQRVASVLRSAMRDEDLVYRYGGEEFVLVFMDAGPAEAMMLAERVRVAVEKTQLTGEGHEPVGPVTISLGLALLPEHGEEVSELIELADVAMYESKSHGRNRTTMWTPEAAKLAA